MERENQQIAFVGGMILLVVWLGFAAHSLQMRLHYLREGQKQTLEVVREPSHSESNEYRLAIFSGNHDEFSYIMPGSCWFISYPEQTLIDVLVLPDDYKVQPVDGVFYWFSRPELKFGLFILAVSVVLLVRSLLLALQARTSRR